MRRIKINKIKLSCLVTNYNQIKWIEEAVESILNQNLDYSYEILIGDDGSNDGSLELLKEKYGSMPHIRIFVQDRDERVKEFSDWRHSRLIFRLLDEAQGEFLSILDGDDYFCDMNHFKQKIEILEKEENKECVACYGNMYNLSNGELKLIAVDGAYPDGRCEWLKEKIYLCYCTSVIRRKALEDVPRNIYYEAFTDLTVTTWLAHKGYFYYIQSPCFVHRILPNSIWNSGSQELNALCCVVRCDLDYRAYGGGGD